MAAVLERFERGHEPGGPARPASGGSQGVYALAAPAAVRQSWNHLPVAGLGTQRSRFPRVDETGPALHRQLVASAGPQDTPTHFPRRPLGQGRPLTNDELGFGFIRHSSIDQAPDRALGGAG